MQIAILSGKGGTGKTLVSVNLAAIAGECIYIDCDVEEPNGHLFFNPQNIETEEISIKVPLIDEILCNSCRKCIDFCKFNALAYIGNKVKVFDNICHSCGGCSIICPQNAISEKDKIIGEVQSGMSNEVQVLTGILNPGKSSGIPIIDRLLDKSSLAEKNVFIDCPPGSACSVMESIKDADYCILVAEPTLFGVHNFNMVYELVKLFKKPHGVVLNKCTEEENPAEVFSIENNIKILAKIPFDHDLGRLNSEALISVREKQKYKQLFSSLLETIIEEVQNEKIINS